MENITPSPHASKEQQKSRTDQLHFLDGGGEMGALIRSLDWSQTSIGDPQTWPPALRMIVRFLLANRFPLLLWWGPDYISIYNDAYCPVLGAKHPWALGKPLRECWSEIWDVLKPLVDAPFDGGPSTWMEDIELHVQRRGFIEETHFTVAYSPVPDETAAKGIGGVLATVHEITGKVVGERRVAALKDLGTRTAEAKTAGEACAITANTLAAHAKDVPFALLYLTDQDGKQARLAASSGLGGASDDFSPSVIGLDGPDAFRAAWPLAAVRESERMEIVENLSTRFKTVPPGPWADAPQSAVVLPVPSNVAHQLAGFLVAGVSAHLALDDAYRNFFEVAVGPIATAISTARAYEEERRRAEALAEIDRAKTAFFSNVSHEFRTPLTLMLGPLEDSLAGATLPVADRERLNVAHRNSLRLLKLVNSLLDFSRIEAGRAQATYQPVDLAALTAELASNFRSACERAHLSLVVDCPPLPELVYVDRDMWEKIVLNLLSNAFKFTFEGAITVAMRTVEGQAELSVRDTGVGVPAHEQPRLFERFHRIEGQRSRTYEGSGIGLALVQELVKLHGGTIRAESVAGQGSAFFVQVPYGKSHLPQDRIAAQRNLPPAAGSDAYVQEVLRWLPEDTRPSSDAPAGIIETAGLPPLPQGAYVLVADDNADMRSYVHRLLGPTCDVKTVADGQEALESIRERRPDLVLSDIMMPTLDGFALLRAIRTDPELRDLPVIFLSARAGEESRVEGLEAGADDYLVKPFSARELIARVSAHLGLSRLRHQATETLRQNETRQGFLLKLTDALRPLADPVAVQEAASRLLGEHLGVDRAAYAELQTGGEFMSVRRDWVSPGSSSVAGVHRIDDFGTFLTRALREGRMVVIDDAAADPRVDSARYESTWKAFGVRAAITYPVVKLGRFVGAFFVNQSSPRSWSKADMSLVAEVAERTLDAVERTSAEAASAESAKRLSFMAESMPQKLFTTNENGSANYFNSQWTEYTGFSTQEIEKRGWTQLVHPDDLDETLRLWRSCLEKSEPFECTHRLRRSDGVYRWHLSRARAMRDERGRVAIWIGSSTNIHQQKETEQELRQANSDLEQFAYSASHDLREPLRNVAIYGQLFKKGYADSLDARAAEFLNHMVEGAQRMENLVSDLLAYTQAARTDGNLPGAVDTEHVLATVLTNLQRSIDESAAVVTHDPLPPAVTVNEAHLGQLFQNLIANSIKYRKDSEAPVIHISANRECAAWRFSVRDNGIGIAPQFHSHIFGLFKRLHAKDGKYKGTGLGLAICQKLVERYGGRIWLTSAEGEGATFYFTLPG